MQYYYLNTALCLVAQCIIFAAAKYKQRTMDEKLVVKDCNGNVLNDGDSVILNKSLDVKGSAVTLKKGTVVKTITTSTNGRVSRTSTATAQ